MISAMSNDDDETDPRAPWRSLPERITPEQWVTEKVAEPVSGSLRAFEEHMWEARKEIEWGAG